MLFPSKDEITNFINRFYSRIERKCLRVSRKLLATKWSASAEFEEGYASIQEIIYLTQQMTIHRLSVAGLVFISFRWENTLMLNIHLSKKIQKIFSYFPSVVLDLVTSFFSMFLAWPTAIKLTPKVIKWVVSESLIDSFLWSPLKSINNTC